jgi:hypothetical protein
MTAPSPLTRTVGLAVKILVHVLSPRKNVVVLLGVFDNLVAVDALPSKVVAVTLLLPK